MKPQPRRDLPDAQLIRMIAARALNAPLAVRPSRVDLRAAIAAAHAAQPSTCARCSTRPTTRSSIASTGSIRRGSQGAT
jgi:hypothetical protein